MRKLRRKYLHSAVWDPDLVNERGSHYYARAQRSTNKYLWQNPFSVSKLFEELLDDIYKNPSNPLYLLWRSVHPTLMVPNSYTHKSNYAAAKVSTEQQGWSVVVTPGGGDLVPLTQGVLNIGIAWSLMKPNVSIEETYRKLVTPVNRALNSLDIETKFGPVKNSICNGRYNLVTRGRKIAGTAQRWKPFPRLYKGGKNLAILAQVTLLIDEHLTKLTLPVNAFYAACDSRHRVEADAHTTVAAEWLRNEANGRGDEDLWERLTDEIALHYEKEFTPFLANFSGIEFGGKS